MTEEQKELLCSACREAVAEVYETTLQLKATFGAGEEQSEAAQEKSVIAAIGFAGSIEASLVMIVSDRTACGLVSCMINEEIKSVDSSVLDGIGEILNMIAGVTKRKGTQRASNFDVCIPSVVLGEKQMFVARLKHTESTAIPVGSEKGQALFLLTSAADDQAVRISSVKRKDREAAKSLQDLVKGDNV